MSTISTTYRGGMLFETQLGRHAILIDVPSSMGGSDRAPTPPEFFVASLGSCIAAFVAQYCERNGPLARFMRRNCEIVCDARRSIGELFTVGRECNGDQPRRGWQTLTARCAARGSQPP